MITFPRVMPTVGVQSQTFEPERVDYLSPEASGRLGAVAAGWPRWMMTLTLNNMVFRNADIWRAWLLGQRGSQRQFIAFDIDRQHPRFHQGGIPYQPSPASWSQTIGSDGTATLQLTGLFAGQVIAPGDYVGFIWDTSKLALVRSIEMAMASGDGVASFAVEPPVPAMVPSDAATNLRQASCLMRLVTDKTTLGEQGLGYFTAGSKITAAQDLVA